MSGRRDGASLPAKLEPDFNIDVAALNAKYGGVHNDDPRRAMSGTFSVPKGMSMTMFERLVHDRSSRFVDGLAKKGWTLISKLQMFGPFPYHDRQNGLVLLDQNEYRLRGAFQLARPKPVRIEIPSRPHERNLAQV